MKLTRLQIVQRVLSVLNEDNITSIGESSVSVQVAAILDTLYTDIVSQFPWPFLNTTVNLESTSSSHIMRIPEDVFQVNWIRYNKKNIDYISYKEMVELLDSRDTDRDNVDSNGAITDMDPTYWTSIGEEEIVFDSYDGSLIPSKSLVEVVSIPDELINDDDYPVLPARFVPVLLWGVMSQSLLDLDGDDSMARFYERKFTSSLSQMKVWGRKIIASRTTFFNLPSYAKKSHVQKVKVIDSGS